MNIPEALILGIVQGLTEFLPISSSAHLVFAQSLIPGFRQPGVLFDVTLHLGTLAAVIFYLRENIASLVLSLVPPRWRTGAAGTGNALTHGRRKMILIIVLATFCTAIISLPCKSKVEELFQSVEFAACMLFITGLLLYLADRMRTGLRTEENLTFVDGVLIGIAQGIAILPGISRSGVTIAAGIFRNMDPAAAARFSFLLSIPAIAGAAILEARHFSSLLPSDMSAYAVGFAAALITGFASLKLLFKIISYASLKLFAYYCWFLAITVLIAKFI